MPFKASCRMEQRIALMMDRDTRVHSALEPCRSYAVE